MKNLVKSSKESIAMVDPMVTLGITGIAVDGPSKVLIGVGMAGLVAAIVVTPVLWVKTVVGGSIVCFTAGFVRGLRKSLKGIPT